LRAAWTASSRIHRASRAGTARSWPATRLPGWRAATARALADLAREQRQEVFAGNGILVFLPQEALLDEDVEVGRQRARPGPALEQANGPGILLPSEDQLGLFLALDHLLPDRHGDRQHDAHDAERDEQGHHRISGRPAAQLFTVGRSNVLTG
jgi:hypothetical protein